MMEHFEELPRDDELYRRLRQLDDGIRLPDRLKAENLRYLMDQADEEMASQPPEEETPKVLRPSFGRWKGWSAAAAVLVLAAAVYWGQSLSPQGGLLEQQAADTAGNGNSAPAAAAEAAPEAALFDSPTAALTSGGRPQEGTAGSSFQDLAKTVNEHTGSGTSDAAVKSFKTSASQQTAFRSTSTASAGSETGGVVQLEGELISYYQPANYQREENTIYLVDSSNLELVSTISVPDNTGVKLYAQEDRLAAVVEEAAAAQEILYDENAYTPISQLDEGGDLGGEAPAVFVNQGATSVIVYDISDAENPKEQYRLTQDGSYFSSYLENGVLYMVTSKAVYTASGIDGSTPVCNAVPILKDSSAGAIPMSPSDISVGPQAVGSSYTVVSAIGMESGSRDTQAVLGDVQASGQDAGNLYLACGAQEDTASQTALIRLTYNGGQLTVNGENLVPLRVDSTFAMIPVNGYLLAAGNCTDYRTNATTGMVVSLDSGMKTVSQLTVPQGVTIRSLSFEGSEGILILSDASMIRVDCSDPAALTQEDLSDLSSAPQVAVSYGEGRVLTLGRNSENGTEAGLRLTLLDCDSGEELAVMQLPGNATTSLAMDDPSLLLTMPENHLAAMPLIVKERTGSSSPKLIFWGYAIFSVDDKGISFKGTVSHGDTLDEAKILDNFQSVECGAVSGNMLYTFSGAKIVATDLRTMENKYQLRLI